MPYHLPDQTYAAKKLNVEMDMTESHLVAPRLFSLHYRDVVPKVLDLPYPT